MQYCKKILMGHSCGYVDDQHPDRRPGSKDNTHEVSEVNDVTWNWNGVHSCYVLTKKMSSFC